MRIRKPKRMKKVKINEESSNIRVSSKNSSFNETEAFRQLRTNIEFSSFSKDIQVVNVTSANPGEGKSTIACNLAIIATAKYDKVLLIDCDLRKPTQHKNFKISNNGGVSGIMRKLDQIDLGDGGYFSKLKFGEFNGHLYVLPAGMQVPNPQELLSSERFKTLIEKCRKEFDFIVIDCPPLNAVVDAIPVSIACDGTIFALSARDTDKRAAKAALTELNRAGANILGCVLNKTEKRSEKYYNYNYYSGYGYGGYGNSEKHPH